MRALLDVNTLIALLDADHKFHRTAWAWMADNVNAGWASCPLTQNGCTRIMSQPGYASPVPLQAVIQRLHGMCSASAHQFFPDNLSIVNAKAFNHAHMHSHKQLTDVYLLALAVKHQARLVTFDGHIPLSAVHGAKTHHLVVL